MSVPIAAGSLQIDGARFQPGAVVRLGADHVLSTTFGSSNQLFAHAPGLPAGVYDLTVTNPDGYAGALAGAYRVIGPAATDLYGFHYELTSARLHEVAGTGSWLIFVVHRLAGDATLTNVPAEHPAQRAARWLPSDGRAWLGRAGLDARLVRRGGVR